MVASPDPFPQFPLDLGPMRDLGVRLVELTPSPINEQQLRLVHPQHYIDRVRHVCAIGGVLDQGDTPVGPGSFDCALLAAGGLLQCCDAVMRGDVTRAFNAARPPGHHAEPDRPMGFCLFSNVAIAARYVQDTYGVKRVAIVDFDVHHGNGTQAAFDEDPSVLFISLHQHPSTCYPGSGHEWDIGRGAGRGYTLNIPFDPGADDDDYLAAFESRVVPKLDDFRPEVLLISAGFDAHRDDPLAGINLSEECFEVMTRVLAAAADRHCAGRVVSNLEGGYNLRALGRSVVRHLIGLSG
jgi:acetoin utilization deacetylase AcuC-like enzyme